ncbi:MAG: endonuclease III [Bacteroidales bacterium]|jgi:endonuclease-3|nr:endonuclease III [Bacteroidales bacterium]
MTRRQLFRQVIGWFQTNMPEVTTELHYRDPYELLVAVILSAQCTDKRVNMITPALFERYPVPELLAEATPEEIFEMIRSCSYPNSKAKHLAGMARMLVDKYGGKVPETVDQLMQLPGVGRKTANVIVSIVFRKPALAVDTHVFRVSGRIGLTVDAKNPEEAERQLTEYFPRHLWGIAHHWLILHGRYVCTARAPKCSTCGLNRWCGYCKDSTGKKYTAFG